MIALKERDLRNDKAAAQWKMTLTVYARPLRSKPIADVATADVLAALRRMWSRIPDTAWRLRGRIERNPFHLKVTRHDHGQCSLTVSRRNPDGQRHALVHFWLKHADIQAIANLAEAEAP